MISNSLPVDAALRTRARPRHPRRHVRPSQRGAPAARLSAVLRPRRGRHAMGRRRQRLCRLHVRLRTDGAGLRQPRGRGRRRCPARPGRRADRPVRTAGRAGREAGRHGHPCRLGAVPAQRHRRHHALRRDRPRRHEEAQDPGGARRLSRLGAVVHAASQRHHRRGPHPPRSLRLQRCREPACSRRRRSKAISRASSPRPSSTTTARTRNCRPGLRPGRAQALRRDRRGADPRRCARAAFASISAAAGRRWACGPTSPPTQQGDRQRLHAGRRHRQRQVPRRRRHRSS